MNLKGKVSYSSPSNIAIVKYWGKEPGDQIPMNPSLSMTLNQCRSFTTIEYELKEGLQPSVEVWFEGARAPEIETKMEIWLEKINAFYPWLAHAALRVDTRNNFPHSAGIASSASGMSALAMCLSAIDNHVRQKESGDVFLQSNTARLGSGSASRSVTGPWVLWGETPLLRGSSHEYAEKVTDVHPYFTQLHDTIIIVDKEPKSISSRAGHSLMDGHPWREGRIHQANENMTLLLKALKDGDWKTFEKVTENEALSLHALMLASRGGMMLWKGNTVEWIHYLRQQREKTGVEMAFTLDAGANIHLLYPPQASEQVETILQQSPVSHHGFIRDVTGTGPEKITDTYEQY
ncbi:MAG: diphosphomevalonate decarboxylase [Bacteroidetes bacterium]|nr:MAG: diphosphomevalonate decarboxylase [Bacteroidota bacterium]